jgi:GNAT superfamily N-acetyltransferase
VKKKIDFSLIKIIPANTSHKEFSYQVKKKAEGDYITQIWGWDEKVQRDYHANQWEIERPSIITYGSRPIGTIYINKNNNSIKIGQFFILPEYQNKGIGTHILRGILESADRAGLIAKLTYLYNNPAASLYARMGFRVIDTKDQFIHAERQPPSNKAKI